MQVTDIIQSTGIPRTKAEDEKIMEETNILRLLSN
jgi:hypothetical protein